MSIVNSDKAALGGEHALKGRAIFAGDIRLPGMLYGCLLGSTQARGRAAGLDLKEALKAPGVVGAVAGQGLLQTSVSYLGQPLAAVCAETPAAAAYAVDRIKCDFAPAEPVFDLEQAMAEGAPSLADGGNIVSSGASESGDVEAALVQGGQLIVARFQTAPRVLAGIEPAACVAAHEPQGLTLYTNRGDGAEMQGLLAEAVGLAKESLNVVCLGCAPAGSREMAMHYAALKLAVDTGRAVKFALSMAEEAAYGLRAPGTVILGRACVSPEGVVNALDLDISIDAGANTTAIEQALQLAGPLTYAPDNCRVRVRQVLTSNPPALVAPSCAADAVRFAVEGLINESARQLGLDPLKVRLANIAAGSPLAKCIEAAMDSPLWDGGTLAGAACFASGVQLVLADTDVETGVVGLRAMKTFFAAAQPAKLSPVLAQIQAGVSLALVGGLKMSDGKALNATDKRLAGSLDMPKAELVFTAADPAADHDASSGVAPAVAASAAAASGGFCTQLPLSAEGLLRAMGRIR